MNIDDISGYEGLRVKAQVLIEHEQTPFLCMHFDKTSGKVFILADSQSLQYLREVKALVEIEDILKRTFDESKKLTMFDQKFLLGSPSYLFCREKRASGLSHHTCHEPKPKYQLSWERNHQLKDCFEDRTPTDADYERLPTEILQGIFEYLNSSDLKSVSLVSKYWKSVGSETALFKEFSLPFKCQKSSNMFLEFIQESFSSKLQVLSLDNFSFQINDDHVKNLLNLELRSLKIGNIDLSSVSDDYIAQVVNNSKECKISENEFNVNGNNINVLGLNKLRAIFRQMENGTKLKSLSLQCFKGKLDLSSVPSNTLANAFSKLESLELLNVDLRPEQFKTIFENTVKPILKTLVLSGLNLDLVDMKIFDAAFRNLSKMSLSGLDLDNHQLNQLAENLDKYCKLKRLMLSDFDFTKLSPGLLARIVTKMRSVCLLSVDIGVDQLEQIFLTISRSPSAIKELNLYDIVNIHEINPEILAMGINKLEIFDFESHMFTEDQTKEIFKVMSQGTCLKMLGSTLELVPLEWMDSIQTVDEEILSNAIHNLEEVMLSMDDSRLTLPQYFGIFKKFGLTSKIKKFCISDEVVYL